jgi:hypothetical protein
MNHVGAAPLLNRISLFENPYQADRITMIALPSSLSYAGSDDCRVTSGRSLLVNLQELLYSM